MSSLTLCGLLTRKPVVLPPRGDFTNPAHLISVLDEDSGYVFQLVAEEEVAEALKDAQTPCKVTVGLRATSLSLADLTNGARKGRAYRLRAVSPVSVDTKGARG